MTGPTQREDPRTHVMAGFFYGWPGSPAEVNRCAAALPAIDHADLAAGFVRVDINDPATIEVIRTALENEGCKPGNSIHSWRCEHPDRYGECDCCTEVARAVLAALRPSDKETP